MLEDQRRSLKHFENVQSGLSIWAEEHLTSQILGLECTLFVEKEWEQSKSWTGLKTGVPYCEGG